MGTNREKYEKRKVKILFFFVRFICFRKMSSMLQIMYHMANLHSFYSLYTLTSACPRTYTHACTHTLSRTYIHTHTYTCTLLDLLVETIIPKLSFWVTINADKAQELHRFRLHVFWRILTTKFVVNLRICQPWVKTSFHCRHKFFCIFSSG